MGQQSLHASQAKGLDSPVCCIRAGPIALLFELWILIPQITFWLATPYCRSTHGHQRRYFHSTMGFSPQIVSHSGPAVPQFQFGNNFKFPEI
jgi:hypothetical protein